MGFLGLLVSALILAWGLIRRTREAGGFLERAGLAILVAFFLLIATSWSLSFCGLLAAWALWSCAGSFLLGGVALLLGAGGREQGGVVWKPTPMATLVLAALGLSLLYLVARGFLIPPVEFDALSYHLPRAVEIARGHGIHFIPSGDFRIASFPWNFELLLADCLLLTGSDQCGFWIGLLSALGFCALAGAMFRRAWPRAGEVEILLGILLVAATPILIIHAAAYKNDMLFAFFLLGAIHWLARWADDGGGRVGGLGLLALGLAFGTKSTALFFLPVAGGLAWRFRARWPGLGRRSLPAALAAAAGVLLLLALTGSAWPILNWRWSGHLLGDTALVGGVPGFQSNAVPRYTGFANLWQFPLLAWMRPFSGSPHGIWVFWRREFWYWPAYNSLYGHFGSVCSLLVLLVPLAWKRHRAEPMGRYRSTLTCTSLAFALLCLPQAYRVQGMAFTFPRYLLCLPVVLVLWAGIPTLMALRDRGWRWAGAAAGVGIVAYFLAESGLCFTYDICKPPALVARCLQEPDFLPDMGVESVLDRNAGPLDEVAFDSGYGACVYPLYGAARTRPLSFLPHFPGPIPVPPTATWVVIDREWNVGWSHPGALTTAEFFGTPRRGESLEDLALALQLQRDPAFRLVYEDRVKNQWIFRRLGPGGQAKS